MKLLWKYIYFCLLSVAGAIGGNSQTQREEIAQSAVTAWKQQQAHLKTVRLRFSGTLSWTPLAPDRKTVSGKIEGKVNVAAVIDFMNNRFRISMSRDEYNDLHDKLEHFNTIHVAVGGKLKSQVLPGSSIVNERNDDFIIQSGGSNAIFGGPLDLPFWRPVLLAAGIVFPKTRITWAEFAPANDSDAIRGFEAYETNAPKKAAILIRNSSKEYASKRTEYWTDPDRDFVVTKYLYQVSEVEQPISRFLEIDYRTTGEIWFPAAWRTTNSVGGRWQYTEDIQVSEIVMNESLSDEEFRLEPSIGMKVYGTDVRLSESNRVTTVLTEDYHVGSSNQKVGLVSHARRYDMARAPKSSSKPTHWVRFVLIGLLLVPTIFLAADAALRRAKMK